MRRPTRTNPVTGYHPDLFKMKDRWPAGEKQPGAAYVIDEARVLEGETPIFVPMESLTAEEIEALPVKAFTPDEWAQLDKDQREAIIENDQESQERIDAFVNLFVAGYKWEEDPDNNNDFSVVEDGFESWLSDRGDKLWTWMPSPYLESILAYAAELGASVQVTSQGSRWGTRRLIGDAADEVQSAINSAMEDSNRYDVITGESEYDEVYSEERRGYVHLDRDDYEDEWKALLPVERDIALKRIAKETHRTFEPDEDDLDHGRTFDMDWETGVTIKVVGKWDEIEEAVKEELRAQFQGDGASAYEQLAAAPPEQRVVHRWPDGFYVQDLLAEELPAEGAAMGMCVGRPEMGYIKAVRNGKIKIMSLRRPSGKPLFTFELELDDEGKVTKIEQIKGKANRLPGFDRGKEDAPLKRDEVERVLEFVEGPLVEYAADEIAFEEVDDLRPAAKQILDLYQKQDPWARSLLIDKLKRDVGAGADIDPAGVRWRRLPAAENPAKACRIHGAACGGFCTPYRRKR